MDSSQIIQATVWTVSFDTRPAQFTNLQTAIDSASAGDTIDGLESVTIQSPRGALNIYTDGDSKFFVY